MNHEENINKFISAFLMTFVLKFQSFLTETQLKEVSKIDDFGRLTCRLMTHLFSKEEMVNGVVCGINKASDKIKLNEEKIRFIEGEVFSILRF